MSSAESGNAFVTVDDRHWPLLLVRYPADPHPDDDVFIGDTEARLRRLLGRRAAPLRFVVLADTRTTVRRISATTRRKMAEMLNRLSNDLGPPVAEAVVVRGELLRLLARGVTFLQGEGAYPREVFTDIDRAERWLIERGSAAGLTVPGMTEGTNDSVL